MDLPVDGGQPGYASSLPGLHRPQRTSAHNSVTRRPDEPSVPTIGSDAPDAAQVEAEMEDAYVQAEHVRRLQSVASIASAAGGAGSGPSLLADVLNISHVLSDGASAIVDDSFNKCFTSATPDPWNWNAYLFPQWALGVIARYLVLFPLRLILLLLLNAIFMSTFFLVGLLVPPGPKRKALELRLVRTLAGAFMLSWNAVVKYHGPKPTPGPNKVWVSNHTSMIDYAILTTYSPFAVIMQLQTGWVRFIQTRILNSLGCLWFNRTDLKDRTIVAERMKAHVASPDSIPLLIFPEGTCVNNEYCVMFKRGAFDLGATVCPVAIKYNKIFVDAFWNSRRVSFGKYLLKLMTSWAVVCDVWFLEPQTIQPGESADEFASRVQKMIADRAGLKVVPWDGYLKYYNLGQAKPGLVEKRRKVIADVLKLHLTPAQVAAAAAARKGGVAGSRAGDGEGGEAPGKVGSLEGKKAK